MSLEAGTAVVHGQTYITAADFRAYTSYAQWHQGRWLNASMMVAVVCLAGVFTSAAEDAPLATVLAGIGLASLVAHTCWFQRRARGVSPSGPAQYMADAWQLSVEMPGARSIVAWERVLGVAETDDHFFLNLRPLQAYVVPKRAFACPADVDRFRRLAQRQPI